MPDIVSRLAKEFEFVVVPSGLPTNEGLTFREGRLIIDGKQIVIGEFVIYSDGIAAKVSSTTADADLVIERALSLGADLGIRVPITPPVHFYQSFVICEFSRSIDELIVGYKALSHTIQQKMQLPTSTHLSALMLSVDPESLPRRVAEINPTAFRIERRVGISYDRNRYFSMANTSTATHLELLEEIERSVLVRR